MKKNSFNYDERRSSDSYDDVVDMDANEVVVEKVQSKAKYPDARKVMRLFPLFDFSWYKIPIFNSSAQILYDKYGDEVKEVLQFLERHKDDEFCPKARTPYELVQKLPALKEYRDKKYG